MEFTKDFFNLILDFGDEWVITGIEADHRKQQVYIDLEYKSDYYEDPETLEPTKLYDHTEVRVWRHLDILHYRISSAFVTRTFLSLAFLMQNLTNSIGESGCVKTLQMYYVDTSALQTRMRIRFCVSTSVL